MVKLVNGSLKTGLGNVKHLFVIHANIIPQEKKNEMTLFKNGKKPPFMDSEEKDLDPAQFFRISRGCIVRNMSYVGLQAMAVYGLLLLGKLKSPAEICRDLETLGGEDGTDELF